MENQNVRALFGGNLPETVDFDFAVVTGAKGFIGSRLVRTLRDVYDVRVLAVDTKFKDYRIVKDESEIEMAGDVSTKYGIEAVLNEVKFQNDDARPVDRAVIFHLAAHTSNDPVLPAESMRLNAWAPAALYRAFCDFSSTRFVFASSFGVYGKCLIGSAVNEDQRWALTPITDYGRSKLMAEHALEAETLCGNRPPVTALRFSNVVGIGRQFPGGRTEDPGAGIFKALIDVLSGKSPKLTLPPPVFGTSKGYPYRDFVHVSDVVAALVRASSCTGRFRAINVCMGMSRSISDVAELAGVEFTSDGSYDGRFNAAYSRGSTALMYNALGACHMISLNSAVSEIVEEVNARRLAGTSAVQ